MLVGQEKEEANEIKNALVTPYVVILKQKLFEHLGHAADSDRGYIEELINNGWNTAIQVIVSTKEQIEFNKEDSTSVSQISCSYQKFVPRILFVRRESFSSVLFPGDPFILARSEIIWRTVCFVYREAFLHLLQKEGYNVSELPDNLNELVREAMGEEYLKDRREQITLDGAPDFDLKDESEENTHPIYGPTVHFTLSAKIRVEVIPDPKAPSSKWARVKDFFSQLIK